VDTAYIIAVVVALVVVGAILALIFSRRRRSEQLHDKFGPEYDHVVKTMGGEKQAQTEFEERRQHVGALDILPLSVSDRERFLADWTAVQSKFVDDPGQAILDADRLIMRVMETRAYPVSDFEQRAADISISYPGLVSNYRAARVIAVKNRKHEANTEELRQAMVHYRSLFQELVGTDTVDGEQT
jgi:hypothetical protein